MLTTNQIMYMIILQAIYCTKKETKECGKNNKKKEKQINRTNKLKYLPIGFKLSYPG